ncbi:MAG: GNAT family N-acetyltransferase [Proteobacteria bacterium]|nr:GNAT family N-acetyltransferase [Pseudomonadota bacterium]
MIGFGVMLITPDHCEMDGAMVLPEYRNQGIQTRMNELRIAHARQIGAKKIIVKIHPECVASIRACEKVGFVPGETKTMSSGVLRTIFELPLKAE